MLVFTGRSFFRSAQTPVRQPISPLREDSSFPLLRKEFPLAKISRSRKTLRVGIFQNLRTMNGIPVIMSGYAIAETYTYRKWFLGKKRKGTRYKEGHAWVIDGYLNRRRKVEIQENGKVVQSYYQYEQLVHCNYGWNGSKDGYYNNAAFDTNKGPVTRSGESYNYQFKLETLYDVKPY